MKIGIVGTGNVGGTLAIKLAAAGHEVRLGVRNTSGYKGQERLAHHPITAHSIAEAVALSEVIILATPAAYAATVATSLGDTTDKVIIDTMNIVMGAGPEGYNNTSEAILDHTKTQDVVKCFNTTGFNNMDNPLYDGVVIDNFVAGDSAKGKEIAKTLSKDIGFAECYDVGGNDKFQLMEQFAFFWINLAMFQGQGREIGFKLLKR